MSEETISALKQNWHLLLLCVGLIVAGVVFGFPSTQEEPQGEGKVATTPQSPDMAQAADKNFATAFEAVPRQHQRANAAILKYEKENEESGHGPVEEQNLYRLGNIYYSILFDYEKAVFSYQTLVTEYPETDKIQMAYVALADSYEKLGQFENEMSTYDIIMQKFPSNSPAYQFAEEKLAGDR